MKLLSDTQEVTLPLTCIAVPPPVFVENTDLDREACFAHDSSAYSPFGYALDPFTLGHCVGAQLGPAGHFAYPNAQFEVPMLSANTSPATSTNADL